MNYYFAAKWCCSIRTACPCQVSEYFQNQSISYDARSLLLPP